MQLPAGHRLVAVVSLGYPAAPQEPKKRSDPAARTLWLE